MTITDLLDECPGPPPGWGTRKYPDSLSRQRAWDRYQGRAEAVAQAEAEAQVRRWAAITSPTITDAAVRRRAKTLRRAKAKRKAEAEAEAERLREWVQEQRKTQAQRDAEAEAEAELRRLVKARRSTSICRQDLLRLLPRKIVDGLTPDWIEPWSCHGKRGRRYWYLRERVQPLLDARDAGVPLVSPGTRRR